MTGKDRSLRLELDGRGRGKVILAGSDISHLVTRMVIVSEVNHPTRVRLTLIGPEVAGVAEDVLER